MPTPSLEELIETVLDRCPGETELERLEVAVAVASELGEAADSLTNHFVETARTAGASWSEIGGALGVSKQGAQQWARRRIDAIKKSKNVGPDIRDLFRGPMFARFTDRARLMVRDAVEEAQHLGHGYVGTEHLLLSMLRQQQNLAQRALARLNVDVEHLRDEVVVLAGVPSPEKRRGRLPFTPRGKRVLELSLREALRMGHNYIGTEHILIALLVEGDGIAGRAMAQAGIELDALRNAVLEELAA